MEIFIVRHGKTKWNEEKRLQGSVDIELNQEGRDLAVITGQALKDVSFDRVYSSPLGRAFETACLISGRETNDIIQDERLRELNFGVNEGRKAEEIEKEKDNPFNNFFSSPKDYFAPEGGESLADIIERTKEFMVEVIEPQKNELGRVMIVGHGAMNKAIMCHVLNHGQKEFWSGGLQKNCGIIVLKLDNDGYHLIDENRVYY